MRSNIKALDLWRVSQLLLDDCSFIFASLGMFSMATSYPCLSLSIHLTVNITPDMLLNL